MDHRIEQWAQRLTGAGVAHSGVIAIPPGAILNFKDPDGIQIELLSDPLMYFGGHQLDE